MNVKLQIPRSSYERIMAYAQACDQEISGFADLEFNQATKSFVVGEVYLLDQVVGAAETSMTEEAVSAAMLQFIKEGKTQMPRLWWHSHVSMQAFFSGTDDATMANLKNDSFIIGLVVNKRYETKTQLRIYSYGIIFDDLEIEIINTQNKVDPAIIAEINKKVTKTSYGGYGWGQNNQSYFSKKYKSKKDKKKFKDKKIIPTLLDDAKELVKDCDSYWYEQSLECFIYWIKNETWYDRWHVLDNVVTPGKGNRELYSGHD